jgi:ubiquitin-protein ligase
VSVLGEKWDPRLKLISVVNSLHYLLTDPNPQSVFDNPRALKAADVCRSHGFPRMTKYRPKQEEPVDVVHFNIVPVPRVPTASQPGDIVSFKILGREKRAST